MRASSENWGAATGERAVGFVCSNVFGFNQMGIFICISHRSDCWNCYGVSFRMQGRDPVFILNPEQNANLLYTSRCIPTDTPESDWRIDMTKSCIEYWHIRLTYMMTRCSWCEMNKSLHDPIVYDRSARQVESTRDVPGCINAFIQSSLACCIIIAYCSEQGQDKLHWIANTIYSIRESFISVRISQLPIKV